MSKASESKKAKLVDPFVLAAAVRLDDPGMPDEDVDMPDPQDPRDKRAQRQERYDRRRTGELDVLVPERICPLCRRRRMKSGQWVVFDTPKPLPSWLKRIARETAQAGCMRAAVCRSCSRVDPRVRQARNAG